MASWATPRRLLRYATDPDSTRPVPVLTAALRRYTRDGMTDRAPTIAYYGILSLFPTLLLAFSLIRLVGGDDAAQDLAAYARERGASDGVAGALRDAAATAREAPAPAAGSAGAIGLLTVVYGASRAFSAAGRAFDAIHHHRSVPRSLARRAEDIGWTLAMLAIGAAIVVLITVSGRVLEDLLGLLGLSGAFTGVWAVLRIPIAAALSLVLVAVVGWAAPTTRPRRFRIATPGLLVTTGLLVVGTLGFGVYVTYIASYNTTYGAFAGAVILLLWIWLAGSALLFGAEVDAELTERAERRGPFTPAAREAGARARA